MTRILYAGIGGQAHCEAPARASTFASTLELCEARAGISLWASAIRAFAELGAWTQLR